MNLKAMGLLLAFCSMTGSFAEGPASAPPLVSFDKGFDFKSVETRDTAFSPLPDGPGARIEFGSVIDWPGITVKPSTGSFWDLSLAGKLTMEATNVSDSSGTICLRVDNPGADGSKNCLTGRLFLAPGQSGKLVVTLSAGDLRINGDLKLDGMHGVPGCKLDSTKINQILVFSFRNEKPLAFKIGPVMTEGLLSGKSIDASKFFPFVDELGQYMHADWPGKVHDAAELPASVKPQEDELAALGFSPEGWDKYGGWEKGPQLEATGFFRVQKYEGKWWLVDPLGRLFWSHGVDCVGLIDATPTTDRESYFSFLPKDGPFAQFKGRGGWLHPPGFYKDYKAYDTYNYRAANLYRKYGDSWKEQFYASAIRRLKAWRMNTLGAWSDGDLYSSEAVPSARSIGFHSRPIEGSSGHWGKFPDPFADEFRKAVKNCVGRLKDSPMCVGYFVNNELAWGSELSLAEASLASPESQPAKQAFLAFLKEKYKDVAALNSVWGSSYADWDALLKSDKAPARGPSDADLLAFNGLIADRYFSICREELKKAAPNALFLGSRFAGVNIGANVIEAAAKHCDIISYNIYQHGVANFKLPAGIDKPVIIGEFHFGALDRGMLHTGLVPVMSQAERAEAYRSYVDGALRNPVLVGSHWFQYTDEPFSGRADGENYQIGLLDVCDFPYKETVDAVKDVGSSMYSVRSSQGK